MKPKSYLPIFASAALISAIGCDIASADTTISYTYQTISSNADTSWVAPVGATSMKAMNMGSGGSTTYGGLTWLTTNAVAESYNSAAPIAMYFSAPGKGWGIRYDGFYSGDTGILWEGSYSNLQNDGVDYRVELNGFTPGQEYLVQFVVADTRTTESGRTITIDGYSANIASQDSSAYQYSFGDSRFAVVTARFTPAAGETDFSFLPLVNGGANGLQLNAVHVLTSDDPFANWMSTNYPGILSPDNQPGADPDNDGMENILEFVLNGAPNASDTSILPDPTMTATDFEFTFIRRKDSASTSQTFQSCNDLTSWSSNEIVIPATNPGSGPVTITSIDAITEQVKITVPKGTNTKLFGRLQVTKP